MTDPDDIDSNEIKLRIKKAKEVEEHTEQESVTTHSVEINGQTYSYTTTAGTIILRAEEDAKKPKAKATFFYIAYTLDDVDDADTRPLTFSFNGGPGSSSVWLHLGVLGPRRAPAEDENVNPVPPPYKLLNNEYSILDKTDLVFIDPVSTGFSRAVEKETAEQFHEYQKDIEWVAEFIRTYTTRNARWTSPKFLIGESYGTTRAAGLAGHLQDKYGMYLNGVMLVSAILSFQTARFTEGNDLPFILFLPSYTATAWYHGLLDDELQKDLRGTLKEVEEFAVTEYNIALMRGDELTENERKVIIEKLARYTGLSTTYIEQTDLRINIHKFVKELLRDQRRTLGRLDSRLKGIDRDATGTQTEYDPLLSYIMGSYSSTLKNYIKKDLEFDSDKDIRYEIMAPLYMKWKYEQANNEYLNVGETLRQAMTKNPYLKVIVLNGYYDLGTPYFASEYTFSHLNLDETLRNNFSFTYYEAGHMMYIHEPSLKQMKEDLDSFIDMAKNV